MKGFLGWFLLDIHPYESPDLGLKNPLFSSLKWDKNYLSDNHIIRWASESIWREESDSFLRVWSLVFSVREYNDNKKYTLLFIGNPDNSEWKIPMLNLPDKEIDSCFIMHYINLN